MFSISLWQSKNNCRQCNHTLPCLCVDVLHAACILCYSICVLFVDVLRAACILCYSICVLFVDVLCAACILCYSICDLFVDVLHAACILCYSIPICRCFTRCGFAWRTRRRRGSENTWTVTDWTSCWTRCVRWRGGASPASRTPSSSWTVCRVSGPSSTPA